VILICAAYRGNESFRATFLTNYQNDPHFFAKILHRIVFLSKLRYACGVSTFPDMLTSYVELCTWLPDVARNGV
jgi:hypothetical protein